MSKLSTDFLVRLWAFTQSILWSLFAAVAAVAITVFALAQTEYVYWVDNALSNGHGPYEISLALVTITLILYNIARIGPFVQRAFLAAQITIVDKLIFAAILWGVVLWATDPWYSGALLSIDWGRLSHVVTACQILWGTGIIWLVARVGLGLSQISTRKTPVQKPRLHSDNPITHLDEDIIGRSNIVNQIISVIRDFDSEGSFVTAVTGDWGTGKTSVLNLALQELKEDKRIIPVVLDPWYLSAGNGQNLNVILKRFFDILEDAIRSRVFRPNISKVIGRYYKAIAPIAEKALIRFDFLFDEGTRDLEAIRDELNDAFRNLGAKVVVFIDDLDRMDGREIAYVFKLIRLCANFDNVVYVVAFDRRFIQEQLEKEFGSEAKAKDYVDKIVQLELPLPKVDPVILDRVFSRYLGEAEQQLNVALLQDQDFIDRLRSVFNPYVLYLLSSIRLIKLFINRHLFVVPVVKGEVNYFDLLVLEIVRLKYPQIYEAIYRHPEHFTYVNNINWTYPSDKDQEVAQFFEGLVANLDTESREAILSLLGSVFNSVRCYHRKLNTFYDASHDSSYRELKSAAHPDYFPRYFYLAVPQGAIPDTVWDELFSQINTATEDHAKDLIDATITELLGMNAVGQWLGRMRLSIPKINREQIPALLLAISNRAKDFSDERAGFFGLGDYRLMNFLVIDLLEQLEPEQVEGVAIRLIESCPDVSFLHDLMYWFDPDGAEGEHAEPRFPQVDFQKLKQFASARLRKAYIEDGRNILTESHHHGGLYALKYFLEPAEYRPYTQQLLEQDAKNALLLLNALTSRGHWSGEVKGGTFRTLDYSTAKFLVEPRQILAIAEGFKPISEMSEDEAWVVDALREGIEAEAEGKTVEHISEFDQKRRERYGHGRAV